MKIRLLAFASVLVVFATVATAQQQSVKPGINDSFQDPDVDKCIAMFEGESREIYKHRNEIVAAVGLKPGMNVADIGAGTGFFSRMFALEVAPAGTVYAVDIAKNFVEHIDAMSSDALFGQLRHRDLLVVDRSGYAGMLFAECRVVQHVDDARCRLEFLEDLRRGQSQIAIDNPVFEPIVRRLTVLR